MAALHESSSSNLFKFQKLLFAHMFIISSRLVKFFPCCFSGFFFFAKFADVSGLYQQNFNVKLLF